MSSRTNETSPDGGVDAAQRPEWIAKLVMYLAFAAAVFIPYGLNLLVLAAAWGLALQMKPRDIPLAVLLSVASLAGGMVYAFLPA